MLHHWQVYPKTSLSAGYHEAIAQTIRLMEIIMWLASWGWANLNSFKQFVLSASNQLFLFKNVTRPLEK